MNRDAVPFCGIGARTARTLTCQKGKAAPPPRGYAFRCVILSPTGKDGAAPNTCAIVVALLMIALPLGLALASAGHA